MFGLTEQQLDSYNGLVEQMLEECFLPEQVSKMVVLVSGKNQKEMENDADFLVQDVASTIIFECVHASYWYLSERSLHKPVSKVNKALTERLEDNLFTSFIESGVACQTKSLKYQATKLAKSITRIYNASIAQTEDIEKLLNDLFYGESGGKDGNGK